MDVESIREDFPELKRTINGYPLAYLDNAATSLKPVQVIRAIAKFYEENNANVGRGIHTLAREATELYEYSRKKVARFIGAKEEEIVFVRNATEALNLVASTWARENLDRGSVIVTTILEHHSNLLPWIRLAREKGAELRVVHVNREGMLSYDELEEKAEGADLITITQKSNVLGLLVNVKRVASIARRVGAKLVVDGAQSVPHMQINVKELGCDFLAFSGHKMLGPTGIGVLYARKELLEDLEPYQVGGGMISDVRYLDGDFEVKWASIPTRFEAGTPNIAGAVGLAAAVDYLEKIGITNIEAHEERLTELALESLSNIGKIRVLGPLDPKLRPGVVSFTVEGFDPHEVAVLLDMHGIAVRSGHHCALPLHEALGIRKGSIRASLYLYNTEEEIGRLVDVLKKLVR